jgi:hypothetical protein
VHKAIVSWGALALELLLGKKQADNRPLRSALAIGNPASQSLKHSAHPDESILGQQPILDQPEPQTNPNSRNTRRHQSINSHHV